ncbi:MAG: hypothetical protein R3213_04840 [Flavobacteriaceae bacterium]|nr:hypothetical protein [Flavobacteriaceae bacterium]
MNFLNSHLDRSGLNVRAIFGLVFIKELPIFVDIHNRPYDTPTKGRREI